MVHEEDQEIDILRSNWFSAVLVEYGFASDSLKRALSQSGDVFCVMAGEVYVDQNAVYKGPQRAQYVIDRYLANGNSFTRELNGSFAIAIFDGRDRTIHLITDRFGSIPIYYHQSFGIAFSTRLTAILTFDGRIGTSYNKDAVAELIVAERVYRHKTLFDGISRLLPASHFTWKDSVAECHTYWNDSECPPMKNLHDWKAASAELLQRVRKSVERRTGDGFPVHVLLSGGLDSRLILACSPSNAVAGTFTNFGAKHSRDTKLATRVSKLLGHEHQCYERPEDHYVNVAEMGNRAVEGMATLAGCHSFGLHDQMRHAGVRFAVSGLWFDLLFKRTPGELPPAPFYQQSPRPLEARRIMSLIADSQVFHRRHHQELMILTLSNELKDRAVVMKEHFIREGAAIFSSGTGMRDHGARLTIRNVYCTGSTSFANALSTSFLHRCIAVDNDLLDFALQIPNEWKFDGRLVRRAIYLADPRLARIADANTGIPAGLCPPWSTALLEAREMPRRIAKRVLSFVPSLDEKRMKRKRNEVFSSQSSWHNNNNLLVKSDRYAKLVDRAVEQLNPEFFDLEVVRLLIDDDKQSIAPRFRKLIDNLLTFGLFDADWGPSSDRRPCGPKPRAIRVHDLTH